MTKKYWAYLAIGLGLAMLWAVSQITSGQATTATTQGKMAVDLGQLATFNNPTSTPYLAYGLIAYGAWLLFA
jgi:hypothetical protein